MPGKRLYQGSIFFMIKIGLGATHRKQANRSAMGNQGNTDKTTHRIHAFHLIEAWIIGSILNQDITMPLYNLLK